MNTTDNKSPSQLADRFILRFHNDGQRRALKERAARNMRSLNAELLYLIEKGVEAVDTKVPDS
jgi:plasmid stability protein